MNAPSNVVSFGRMSVADYERERAALRETYGESSTEAAAKRDQALARLFYRSGWTQEELAKIEKATQQSIAYRVRFGRFLGFTTTVVNSETLPASLTERRFRSYWERTDKSEGNERQRFAAVLRLMQEEISLRQKNRPKIGPMIVEQFGDGKWHPLAVIAEAIGSSEKDVTDTLTTMKSLRGTHGARCERKKVGTSSSYRIFRQTRMISSAELKTKLTPLIEGLKAEGKKNMATMSPATVAHLAGSLQLLLDEWTE
jgi:hypothetical protein